MKKREFAVRIEVRKNFRRCLSRIFQSGPFLHSPPLHPFDQLSFNGMIVQAQNRASGPRCRNTLFPGDDPRSCRKADFSGTHPS
jgi:hypothetical protein